jgi:RNA polymerase sigma-70 factor, ECF subfamily
MPANSCA